MKQDILLYLLDNNIKPLKQLMDMLGYKTTKATDLLAEMAEEELIVRKGNGRDTHYVLNK